MGKIWIKARKGEFMDVLDEKSLLEAIESHELLGDYKAAKKFLKKYRIEKEKDKKEKSENLIIIPHLKAL